jgi:hypothetical protein
MKELASDTEQVSASCLGVNTIGGILDLGVRHLLINSVVWDPETRGLVTGLVLGAYTLVLWLIVTRV